MGDGQSKAREGYGQPPGTLKSPDPSGSGGRRRAPRPSNGTRTATSNGPADQDKYASLAKMGDFPTIKDPKSIRILGMRFLDPSLSQCTACRDTFNQTTNRKHWCRRCGRIFCDACTQKRQQLYTAGPFLRVCKNCSTPALFQLPISLLQRAFSYFDTRTLSRALATCHRFQLGINVPFQEIRNIHDFYDKDATRYLQKGAFGSVFSAELLQTRAPAAIKVIDKYSVHTLREWMFIRREIALHQTLNHPNIVQLMHVYQTRSKVYIVMELGQGDLFDYMMRKGFMTEKEVVSIASQLLRALEYLHSEMYVVHRDIKPENILVFNPIAHRRISEFSSSAASLPGSRGSMRGEVVVKLCDLGLAKGFPPSDEPKVVSCTPCGTLNYCPPEVLAKKTETTTDKLAKLDIFSLGIVLHVLVSGVEPFHGRNPADLLKSMRRPLLASGPEWAKVSDRVRSVILAMLQFSSQLRPTAREALNRLCGVSSPVQSPVTTGEPLIGAATAGSPPTSPPKPISPQSQSDAPTRDAEPLVEKERYKERVAESLREGFGFRLEVDEASGGLLIGQVQKHQRRRDGEQSSDGGEREDQLLGLVCLAETDMEGGPLSTSDDRSCNDCNDRSCNESERPVHLRIPSCHESDPCASTGDLAVPRSSAIPMGTNSSPPQ